MLNLAGQKLGKYQIIERLGRGGMAVVYKAYQPGLERLVAVKVLTGQFADIPEFVSRFKREARSIAQLRHPHIVQVFDFDAQDDQYYMVMEYIQGGTLHQRIAERGALPLHEALDIATSLSDALAYAHQRGMIHRDIKPANVMFTDGGQAVLTDFGIARIIGETTAMTSSGGFIGTPAYISPEVGRGEKVDERTDIYSMGVMLFEMVTGRMPYYGDTPYAVIMKHVHDPLPSLREFSLPEAVEEVIYKALAKRVDLRYQNAAELRQALEEARVHVTDTPTQPEEPRTRILPPDSEALATPILSSGALRIPAHAPTVEPEAEPRRRHSRGILVALGAAVTIFLAGFVALRGDYPPSVTAPPTDDNAPVLAATSTESLPTAIPTEMPTQTLAPTPIPTLSDSPTPFEPRVRRLFVTRAPATPTEIPSPTPVPPTRRPIVAPSSSDNSQQNNTSSSGGQQGSGGDGTQPTPSGGGQQNDLPPDSGQSNPVSDTVNTVGDTVDHTVDTVNDVVCTLLCP